MELGVFGKNFADIIRSLIFNILFFFSIAVFMLVGLLFVPGGRGGVYRFWHYFSVFIDFLARKVAGITYTVEGRENKKDTPAIYAIRHESAWETLVPVHFFWEPIFLIKKELAEIPVFGILAKKAGAIPIDREEGVKALMEALKEVEKGIVSGHSIIMYPEGTRVQPGEHAELKRGIALFYARAKCPVIPVIHNSGTFWGRRSFLKRPGNIIVRFMRPIEPGLSKEEFMRELNAAFKSGVNGLKRGGV